MMPALNPEAREFMKETGWGQFLIATHEQLSALTKDLDVSLLTGGIFYDKFVDQGPRRIPLGRRNTAYFYDPTGQLSDLRYDKIHLVPFGEYIPFRQSAPWLYKILFKLISPYDYDYTVQGGDPEALTVYSIATHTRGKPVPVVAPICFEDARFAHCWRTCFEAAGRSGPTSSSTSPTTAGSARRSWPSTCRLAGCAASKTAPNRAGRQHRDLRVHRFQRADFRAAPHPDRISRHGHGVSRSRTTLYTRFGDAFAGACTILASAWAATLLVRSRWAPLLE